MKCLFKILVLTIIGFSFGWVPENDVFFVLRNKKSEFGKEQVFTYETREKLIESKEFDPSKPVIFHVHGFNENRKIKEHKLLSKEIINKNDANLFFVDWSKGATTIVYASARSKVNDVAKIIGDFYNYFQSQFKNDPSKTSCIGFSLGAHICGLIYQYLEKEKFGEIIGLDPAGPLFDVNDNTTRINSKSGDYVECIHTGFPLGIRAPICQADFFASKGEKQPGCQNILGFDNLICSHYRAVHYYIEASQNPQAFYGNSCDSFESVLIENFNDAFGAFMCNDENSKKKLQGIFSVNVNPKFPNEKIRE
ncbi:hypothetical protein PVAND_002489 [Polypedilum vanderplanki]|uniref:Lipase domain-containing protein n=1 Tax=Polypedilum vanderplanki TaxID=319348 RepID=A0A9J6BR57_POLVA|nr:hypothetical protein PVAND_002489 [Polypedilum vanderplanki]